MHVSIFEKLVFRMFNLFKKKMFAHVFKNRCQFI